MSDPHITKEHVDQMLSSMNQEQRKDSKVRVEAPSDVPYHKYADLQSRLTAAETRVKELEQTLKSAGHFTVHHRTCEIVRKSDFQNTPCTCGLDNLRAELYKLKSK